MADHVPAHSARAGGNLGFGFLDLILAEEAQPERSSGADDFWRLTFGHRDKGHRGRFTSRSGESSFNPQPHRLQIGLKIHAWNPAYLRRRSAIVLWAYASHSKLR